MTYKMSHEHLITTKEVPRCKPHNNERISSIDRSNEPVNEKSSENAKKRQNRQRQEERNLLFRLHKTIDHHFPDLYEKIEAIPECRKQPDYRLVDLLMAGLAMFVFKKGSRNAMNMAGASTPLATLTISLETDVRHITVHENCM